MTCISTLTVEVLSPTYGIGIPVIRTSPVAASTVQLAPVVLEQGLPLIRIWSEASAVTLAGTSSWGVLVSTWDVSEWLVRTNWLFWALVMIVVVVSSLIDAVVSTLGVMLMRGWLFMLCLGRRDVVVALEE